MRSKGTLSHEVAAAFQRVQGVKLGAMKDRTQQYGRTKITPAEMRRLCSLPDRHTVRGKRDAVLLATLASSGLRVTELASLTVGQILNKGSGYVLTVRGKNDTEYRERRSAQRRTRCSWSGSELGRLSRPRCFCRLLGAGADYQPSQ